jgi:hypothetical protein
MLFRGELAGDADAIFSTSAFTVPLGWMAFCCCRVWISWETSSPMAASCCVENSR